MMARFYKHWQEHVFPMLPIHRPRRFLEIGIAQGDTARFIYNHGRSTDEDVYVGIDPWPPELEHSAANERRAKWRIERTWGAQSLIFNESSNSTLKRLLALRPYRFDLIFIDGRHTTEAVLNDAILSWPLLENGGIMVFDDWGRLKPDHVQVKAGVEKFVSTIAGKYKELFRTLQYIIQKTAGQDG